MSTRRNNWYLDGSSSEEEEKDLYRQVRSCSKVVPCSNDRCDEELLLVNNKDYYCSRDCYCSKLERHKRGDTGILLKRITLKGRGGTGLLRDCEQLDHLVIEVNDAKGRVVKVNNSGSAVQRWKKQRSKEEKTAATKTERQLREEQNERLKELLNPNMCCSSSSEESSNEEDTQEGKRNWIVEETAREEIRILLSSGVNSNICPLYPLVATRGMRLKGYIINVVSPWELYIQTEEMVLETLQIDEVCNRPEGLDPRLVCPDWQPEVEGFCVAKYEDKFHRAKILEQVGPNFKIKYMDYGNIDVVPRTAVFQLNPAVTLMPRQYLFFKMSNVKPLRNEVTWSDEVCQFLMEHLDGGIVEFTVDAVDRRIIYWGTIKVLSSLSKQVQGDMGNILVERQMAEADSYYVLKHCSINSQDK